ncbi:MAG: hypothetical protein AAF211_00905 [Myxococcota bacterium]
MLRVGLAGGVVFGLGMVAGRWSIPETQEALREPPGSVICATQPLTRPTVEVEEPTPVDDLRLSYCLARLEASLEQQRLVLRDWPEEADYYLDGQHPAEWTETLDAVASDCGIRDRLVITDCTEPPCVAAFRGDRRSLRERLDGCSETLGPFGDPELVDVPVNCGDGRTESLVLLANLGENGQDELLEGMGIEPGDSLDGLGERLFHTFRIYGRRADALAALWPCDAEVGAAE